MLNPQTDSICIAVHGLAVQVQCDLPGLAAGFRRMFHAFVSGFPDGFNPVVGTIRAYDESEVAKHLSPRAQKLALPDQVLEIYADDERFWLVDDRWGLAEINLLKGQWRSWVLPRPRLDMVRCIEQAIVWPMAQLLRPRGLHVLPVPSLAWGGRGILLLAPFGIEPELSTLLGAGYRVIGQRWTALREEDDRIVLLHMPGRVERVSPPRLRVRHGADLSMWIDLLREHPLAGQHHAFCESVVIIEPCRRDSAHARPIDKDVVQRLRDAWPMPELHPIRRHPQLAARLAQRTKCYDLTLSRQPQDLLRAMYDVHYTHPRTPQVTITLPRPTRARSTAAIPVPVARET